MRSSLARLLAAALLAHVVGASRGASEPPPPEAWHEPARYRLVYTADLRPLAAAKPARWRVWLPQAADNGAQTVTSASVEAPVAFRVETDATGNRITYLEGAGAVPERVVQRFEVERGPTDGIRRAAITAGSPLEPSRYRRPNALIPLDGVIRALSEEQSRGLNGDATKARAFYDYIVRTLRDDKSGTGWGRGDAIWACDHKRGNCTDFHSLFIGLARVQGIPARFLIGVPIPSTIERAGDVPGYHCWAEWFDDAGGWIPLDASEAAKSGWYAAYYGALPNDRVEFTAGRDLVLAPPQDGPPLNYFIHPYAEADGRPVEGLTATFAVERLT